MTRRHYLLLAGALLFSAGSMSDETSQSVIRPVPADAEVRSVIRESDGYANLGEDLTVKDARKAAFENARHQALDSAETLLESRTQVKNGVLDYDIIQSEAEGTVTVLEQKDHGVDTKQRYHVWIRAEVQYVIGESSDSAALLMQPEAPLTVRVWTEKKNYRVGEHVEIYLHGNRDFYGRVYDIMSDGTVVQLLPNEFRSEHFFRGGKAYRIPDAGEGDQFDLEVTEPFGRDQIVVYASELPLGDVPLTKVGKGLGAFEGDRRKLGSLTRGLRVTAKKAPSPAELASKSEPKPKASPSKAASTPIPPAPPTAAEFYEATWEITTQP